MNWEAEDLVLQSDLLITWLVRSLKPPVWSLRNLQVRSRTEEAGTSHFISKVVGPLWMVHPPRCCLLIE